MDEIIIPLIDEDPLEPPQGTRTPLWEPLLYNIDNNWKFLALIKQTSMKVLTLPFTTNWASTIDGGDEIWKWP